MRLALVVVLVAACGKKSGSPPAPVKAEPLAVDDASAPSVSLLTEPTQIAVSSLEEGSDAHPDNVRDSTKSWAAWRNDEHPRIMVRLPNDDRVTAVRLVTHHAAKVVVAREGKLLREVQLAPNLAHEIRVDAPGGELKIEMVAPRGEVVISSFDVVGHPGASRPPSTYPHRAHVRVDSFLAPAWVLPSETSGLVNPGPWPTLDAYCKQYEKELGDEASRVDASANDWVDNLKGEPMCSSTLIDKIEGSTQDPASRFATVRVRGHDFITTWFAVHTSRGWFPQTSGVRNERLRTGFMNPEEEITRTRAMVVGYLQVLLLETTSRGWSPIYGGDEPRLIGTFTRALTPIYVDNGFPNEGATVPLSEWTGDIGMGFDGGALPEGPRATYRVEADGGISLSHPSAEAGSTH